MSKILIAEDDRDIRELILLTLKFHGFEVVSAEDGETAVKLAPTDNFDLILMDVRMPKMTGYEACRKIKAQNKTKDIPVIFLSAKGQEAEIETGYEVGAADYILKPFAPQALVDTITHVLNR
ncbi:MAG: response regulator [Anaerolineales bacterium]|nr:response regulator [Anaerolineales bacterium]